MQQRTLGTDLSVSASGLRPRERDRRLQRPARPRPEGRPAARHGQRGVTVVDTADIYDQHADDGLVGALGLRGHLTMAPKRPRPYRFGRSLRFGHDNRQARAPQTQPFGPEAFQPHRPNRAAVARDGRFPAELSRYHGDDRSAARRVRHAGADRFPDRHGGGAAARCGPGHPQRQRPLQRADLPSAGTGHRRVPLHPLRRHVDACRRLAFDRPRHRRPLRRQPDRGRGDAGRSCLAERRAWRCGPGLPTRRLLRLLASHAGREPVGSG